jgi:hypothetical protein
MRNELRYGSRVVLIDNVGILRDASFAAPSPA